MSKQDQRHTSGRASARRLSRCEGLSSLGVAMSGGVVLSAPGKSATHLHTSARHGVTSAERKRLRSCARGCARGASHVRNPIESATPGSGRTLKLRQATPLAACNQGAIGSSSLGNRETRHVEVAAVRSLQLYLSDGDQWRSVAIGGDRWRSVPIGGDQRRPAVTSGTHLQEPHQAAGCARALEHVRQLPERQEAGCLVAQLEGIAQQQVTHRSGAVVVLKDVFAASDKGGNQRQFRGKQWPSEAIRGIQRQSEAVHVLARPTAGRAPG